MHKARGTVVADPNVECQVIHVDEAMHVGYLMVELMSLVSSC